MRSISPASRMVALTAMLLVFASANRCLADFDVSLGSALNYGVLYEGNGVTPSTTTIPMKPAISGSATPESLPEMVPEQLRASSNSPLRTQDSSATAA